jgi:hypothetical protein
MLAIFVATLLTSASPEVLDQRVREVGSALCEKSESKTDIVVSDVERIGTGLMGKLRELQPKLKVNCTPTVKRGDAPLGDGSGTHWLTLTSEGTAVLYVRLRYLEEKNQFQILGWYTPF